MRSTSAPHEAATGIRPCESGSTAPGDRIFAGALVLAAGLQIAESLVPRIPLFPWLRLGVSWAVLLPFLLSFGVRPALSLFLARNILSLVFGGQPPSTFLVSTLSGCAAILLCGGAIRWATSRRWIGWIGAGVWLSAAFNVIQLAAVTTLFVGHSGNLFQLGPILAWSIASGVAVAWIAKSFSGPDLWTRLESAVSARHASWTEDRGSSGVQLALWSALTVAPFLLPRWEAQAVFALAAGIHALARRGTGDGWMLLKSWPYFAFLAWFHLLETPGHFLSGMPVTSEGLRAFAFHALRLCGFLLASQELARRIPWTRIAPGSLWARGIGLALPLLPDLFPASVRAARAWWASRRAPDRPGLAESLLAELAASSRRDPATRADSRHEPEPDRIRPS